MTMSCRWRMPNQPPTAVISELIAGGGGMAEVLIRDVPEAVLLVIRCRRLTWAVPFCRRLASDAASSSTSASVDDLVFLRRPVPPIRATSRSWGGLAVTPSGWIDKSALVRLAATLTAGSGSDQARPGQVDNGHRAGDRLLRS